MNAIKLLVYCLSLLCFPISIHAMCDPNPCSLPTTDPRRCFPVDLPNTCDEQHWCIDRDGWDTKIEIRTRKDEGLDCGYFVDVDVTYQLSCTNGSTAFAPYNDVWLWLTRRPPNGCDLDGIDGDLGEFPLPHYMCNTIVAGPWHLPEVENPTCGRRNTRKFTTAVDAGGCNAHPPSSIDISPYTSACPSAIFFGKWI
jgi:hypothetical protein